MYTYLAAPDCSIELSVPGQTVSVSELHRFSNVALEVEAFAIESFFDKRGKFTFKVFQHGKQITEQWIDVNAITGNASGGTMESISLLRLRKTSIAGKWLRRPSSAERTIWPSSKETTSSATGSSAISPSTSTV